jgi:DNA primase
VTSPHRVPVPKLLELLGIRWKKGEGRKLVAVCPDPLHADKNPSWSIIDDPRSDRHGSHWCFACGFGGGPWELISAVRGVTLEEAGEWCREHVLGHARREAEEDDVPLVRVMLPAERPRELTLPAAVRIPSVDGSEWHPRALEYLTTRGVPEWQLVRWHVGYSLRGKLAWRVVVPVYTGGLLLSFVARAFIDDGRVRYYAAERSVPGARPDAALWGEPGFNPAVRVGTCTEGVFKGFAMERAGAPNPHAVLGSQNLGHEKIELLARSFDGLLIATDPDKAGEESFTKIADATCRYLEPVRVSLVRSPDDATEEENGAAWREALRRAGPAIAARRAARLGRARAVR